MKERSARQRETGRRAAHVITLIVAAGLLVATSQSMPSGSISRATLIPAGQQSATATVHVEFVHEGLAETARPFNAELDVSSASLPTADGTSAPAASVDTSVKLNGEDVGPDTIPGAGSCDDERCQAEYTLQFTLERPAEADVVVWWELHVDGPEGRDDSTPVHLTVDGDVDDALPAQRLDDGTLEVRLDRVGEDDTRIDFINGGERAAVVSLPGGRLTVPAGASARIPAFAACDRPACTVHARLEDPLDGGLLVMEGPVVATPITERPIARIDAPTIRSEPVTLHVERTAEAPSHFLEINVEADQGLRLDFDEGPDDDDLQVAVLVRMRLNARRNDDTVVRFRPNIGTEPIVLSAAAGEVEEITLTAEPGKPSPDYWGELELLTGPHAEVEVTVEAIAAYPAGVPRGGEVTATVTDYG